jgi:uncharacterized protein (TIGR03437 family)
VDRVGNIYVIGVTGLANYLVKNSLVPCGLLYLTIYSPSGELLQSTYLAGLSANSTGGALALGPNSTVHVVAGLADPEFVPTYQVGAENGPFLITRLSPNEEAQPVRLVCVGNAASYASGPVAAGEIVSLFGVNLGPAKAAEPEVDPNNGFPTTLAEVQVTFDGTPAPLLYVQERQINAIAPWSLTTGQVTEICVSFKEVMTNCLKRPVAKAAPGVFTTDGRHAVAMNSDGTMNSAANPARLESIISIFATGLGPIMPPQSNGAIVGLPLPVNILPTKISIIFGGIVFSIVSVDTQYAGPVPFQVAGLSQVSLTATANLMSLVVGEDFYRDSVSSNGFVLYVTDR